MMVMERTTLMRKLEPLQPSEFIVSCADGSRLAFHLSISAAAGKKIKETFPLWLAAQAEFDSQTGKGVATTFRASLLKIVRRDGSYEPHP